MYGLLPWLLDPPLPLPWYPLALAVELTLEAYLWWW